MRDSAGTRGGAQPTIRGNSVRLQRFEKLGQIMIEIDVLDF